MTQANSDNPRPFRPTLPVPGLSIRPEHEAVRPAGPSDDDGRGGYPFLVIRLMSAVYQAEKIQLREGPPSVVISAGKSLLQHPQLFRPDGQVSEEARQLLIAGVLAAVRRSGFRMCLVWGPAWCSFIETDGSVQNAFEPPSGGFSATGAAAC